MLLPIYCLLTATCSLHAAFKENDWGSRPTAMGGAFTAVSDDSNAIVHNPAGLVQLDKIETNLMYAKLYTGLDKVDLGLNYMAVGFPLKEYGTVGFGWTNFASQDVYQEDTFYVSYGRWLFGDIAGGISAKYLGHRYGLDERTKDDPVFESGNSKYALTCDAGLYSIFGFEESPNTISVGLSAKNITQPDVGLKTPDLVPMEISIGAAYNTPSCVLPTLDVSYRFQEWGSDEDKITVKAGAETWLLGNTMALRGGVSISRVSFGFGLRPSIWGSMFQMDYTFLWPLEIKQTQGTHLVSLTIRFDRE